MIKKAIQISFILACTINYCYAQRSFEIKDGSKNYFAKISVKDCKENTCSGTATIKLYLKSSSNVFQTLKSEDLYFSLNENEGKPTININQLYGEQSPLIFNDFNFDGYEDLAIRNGNRGGYGAPSYDVYVFNATKKQFVRSSELTELASSNLGMFETDKTRKRIITFSKSGCCWHETTEYEVVFRKGLQKVKVLTENGTVDEGEHVEITEKNLIHGVWKTKKKKYKIKEYYKE